MKKILLTILLSLSLLLTACSGYTVTSTAVSTATPTMIKTAVETATVTANTSGENTITIDSIDVLEVVVAIQKTFDVKIQDQNHARLIVNTVDTIAEFVYAQHH